MHYITKNPFERKQKGAMSALCIICVLFFTALGCGKNVMDSEAALCDDMVVVYKLSAEPAIVRKSCFQHVGRVDTFYFELLNRFRYPEEFFADVGVFPIGEVPQEYRKEGLSVYISGDVTSCIVAGGCVEPNIRLAYIHLFKLSSIKIK